MLLKIKSPVFSKLWEMVFVVNEGSHLSFVLLYYELMAAWNQVVYKQQ